MIKKVFIKKLAKFENKKGDVLICYKEKIYDKKIQIKEIYFTKIKYKKVKGWIKHSKLSCNFTVPVGKVRFIFMDKNHSIKKKIIIGEKNYKKIYVPKNTWFAFEGLSKKTSLVVNYLDQINDNSDILKKDFNF